MMGSKIKNFDETDNILQNNQDDYSDDYVSISAKNSERVSSLHKTASSGFMQRRLNLQSRAASPSKFKRMYALKPSQFEKDLG
jgi:hypothetical protein